ncbi:MAG TPA: DNA mismatch repair protein MutS [Ruminiclostridium sp.]
MKTFLMYKDHDFDLKQGLPENEQTLRQDLELDTLFSAMAKGDEFLFEVASKAVLTSLKDLESIQYRQNILKDCQKNSELVRDIYNLAVEAIDKESNHFLGFANYADTILFRAIEVLEMFLSMLRKLKSISDEARDKFESEGFVTFFKMINKELDEKYFDRIQKHLSELIFPEGVLISVELGKGNKGTNYILRTQVYKKLSLMDKILTGKDTHSFNVSDRDENAIKALSELNNRGLNLVANALTQSMDHILSFFSLLRTELGFYVGCLNLQEELKQKGEAFCFPKAVATSERKSYAQGLYDICLALTLDQGIVGNDVNADKKELVIITGANQGGKSTFLRSIGVSQLMLQCGMFVPAEAFCTNLCEGLFTHYKREEDSNMNSGKLEEELSRMSYIIDNITSNSMILFNESFAATNEREGSEIGRQIICALLEKHIKVFSVTHLYDFAHGFYEKQMEEAIFLRAERQSDGGRSFKIIEGEPLKTSFGEDLYDRIFGVDKDVAVDKI